jgi:hypothetical protein
VVGSVTPPPTYVMSFWRCGSNFLCNVLSRSSGTEYVTIYDPALPLMERETRGISLIKSHAPSYAHLLAEHGAYFPNTPRLPHRFLVLWRDPRDMFISMYDWMCARYRTEFPQKGFLNSRSHGYAVAGMGCLTWEEALRLFVRSWWTGEREIVNQRTYRFEDVLEDKEAAFMDMIEFTGLDCPLDRTAFEDLVKCGRSDRTRRGVPGAWREYADSYGVLLEQIESAFSEEITLLGYE